MTIVTSRKARGGIKVSPVVIVLAISLLASTAYILVGKLRPTRADVVGDVLRRASTGTGQIAPEEMKSTPAASPAVVEAADFGQPEENLTPSAQTSHASQGVGYGGNQAPTVSLNGEPSAEENHRPEQVFDNPVENWLEMVSREGFESLETPRVNMTDEETIAFLKKPVDIFDDDDEETKVAKERTAEVKALALEYIRKGGTLNQFLRDYAAEAKERQETINDVKDEMKRILHDEGVEAAQAYLDEVNPKLIEQGLKEVTIGKGTIKMMERTKAREARQANDAKR